MLRQSDGKRAGISQKRWIPSTECRELWQLVDRKINRLRKREGGKYLLPLNSREVGRKIFRKEVVVEVTGSNIQTQSRKQAREDICFLSIQSGPINRVGNMGNLFCCIKVEQSTVAIKGRFGKFDEVLEPGCHCMPWFLGSQLAGHLSLRLQQLDVKCETKTKDNVFVNVVASIQYRALANKASDAFYKLSNTRIQIQAYVFDVIRASVPKLNLDDVFEQKNEIAKAVEEELEKAMSAYGYEIVQTLIVDIEPDEHVKRAMNEINAAARLRVAANEKAEAEKIIQIKRAEGEAESKYLSGLGIARQRQAIVDGLRDSVLGFSVNVPGTTAKDVMDMVLVTQYFDTMKEIGAASKSSAVFIPHGPGAVRDIATQIRDGLLQASSHQH
ncbi:PREDICTED: hypersensitive-induced response protein 1-like isoform X1 [Nelumbo nucifera]|uniref:Band 7 domain-containing protein n=3 Tax=Nelumbo nucifera TaxID=4432 RepID=A0A822YG78_NELNU|nr:PREDICTED: hypersensitive-induced response protein 1-like isoform X1 [Nelumbo nucifera]DAD31163.1 TPA_asm: hypothetical protein HUJ06_010014 [Nelumbo nucifera]